MSSSKSTFSWCRLILYIISAIAAYFIANRFAPIESGLLDVLIALLLFLAALFFFMWLSRFVCGMLGGREGADGHLAGTAAGAVGAAGGVAAGAASAAKSGASKTADAASNAAGATAKAGKSTAGGAKDATSSAASATKDTAAAAKASFEDSFAGMGDGKSGQDKLAASKTSDDKAKASAKSAASTKTSQATQTKEKKAAKSSASDDKKASSSKSAGAATGGESPGTKPRNLKKSADGKADNLKEIKGIGPKLEKLCHKLGIFHFSQIAEWKSDEIEWMDSNLEGFHGRVTRDDWVGQAKILASGGETEFSQRVEDGEVY